MELIILSGAILVAAYFIYSAIQRSNDLKEKQLEQKERELENNPEYRYMLLKDQYDHSVSYLRGNVEKAEIELRKAQKDGDKKWIADAKSSLAYDRRWLKIVEDARDEALADIPRIKHEE